MPELARRLLPWYRKHRRALPWRRTRDPYRIWVSEVMLQQTTVETVIPYYQRFLRRFPNVATLARATEDEVLRYWSGMGYYSRARNLHKAAQVVTSQIPPNPPLSKGGEGGIFPKTAHDWIKLPGIGRYTAGAIASIAFGERTPILDGNVIRVLSRLFAIRKSPKSTEGNKFFWKKAEEILPQKDCGDFNQALMELGAVVCLPLNPLCRSCPVAKMCRAHRGGNVAQYPRGKKRVDYEKVRLEVALIERNGKLLMQRRPDHGVLQGMWEFPLLEKGFVIHKSFPPIRHSIMNRRLTIHPCLCRLNGIKPRGRWFHPAEIERLATSSMNRKILALLRD